MPMYFISALPVANIRVSLLIQILRAYIFLGVVKWTVCPPNKSSNSFHAIDSELQRKSFKNIASASSFPSQEYLLSDRLETVSL